MVRISLPFLSYEPDATMIPCPVCRVENDEFATTCRSCKAFLQNRVVNLDLFETAWKILEAPKKTFQRIAIAEHKNYSLALFSMFGISLSFTLFWYLRLGDRFDTLLDLVPTALGAGLVLGLLSSVVLSGLYHGFAKLLGGKTSFRNSFAILAYAATPVVLSLFLVLPIELLTFGMYLFTWNPHPYTIKPVSYVALIGFDGIMALWSVLLATLGTVVGHHVDIIKAIVIVLLTVGMYGFLLLAAAQQVLAIL